MRPSMAIKDLHLADLHERARELGVPRYRMLSRDQLIEAIEAGGEAAPEPEAEEGEKAAPAGGRRRRSRRRGRRGGSRQRREGDEERGEPAEQREKPKRDAGEPREDDEAEDGEEVAASDDEVEEVTGVLDRMPQGYG